jgi:hypothetical protein
LRECDLQGAANALVQQRELEPAAAAAAAAAAGAPQAPGPGLGEAATEAELDGRIEGALAVVGGSIEIWRLCFRQPDTFVALLHAVLLSRYVC